MFPENVSHKVRSSVAEIFLLETTHLFPGELEGVDELVDTVAEKLELLSGPLKPCSHLWRSPQSGISRNAQLTSSVVPAGVGLSQGFSYLQIGTRG